MFDLLSDQHVSPPLRAFTLREGESLDSAQRRYIAANPVYKHTAPLDTLRRREFKRLRTCRAYLDYTGAGLYPESLVNDHANLLSKNLFGNPHSTSPSSVLSTNHAQAAREAVLEFFGADASEYDVVFTANASTALRLVGESYPFQHPSGGTPPCLVLPVDAHNSVNGLREFAYAAGAPVHYVPMDREHMGLEFSTNTDKRLPDTPPPSPPNGPAESQHLPPQPHAHLHHLETPAPPNPSRGLFVLTGQSNVSARKSPLSTLRTAKSQGYDTLLDAAALAPTTPISLRGLGNCVDAMAVSLYKMIGYPTGVGCLVVRRAFLAKLRKRWFSGGTVLIVQAPGKGRLLLDGHERWEDGTINFLSLTSVPKGLQMLKSCLPLLSRRLPCIMHFTLSALSSLHHANGSSVVLLHSPSSPTTYSPDKYGAVISLSVLRASGERVPPRDVERKASEAGIHIRAGCMCNPGAASSLLGLSSVLSGFQIEPEAEHEHDFGLHFQPNGQGSYPSSGAKRTCSCSEDTPARVREVYARNENMVRLIEEEGVVRISFGLASSLADAAQFVEFVRKYVEAEAGTRAGRRHSRSAMAEAEVSREKEEILSAPAQDLEASDVGCTGRRASTSAIPHWQGICKLAAKIGRRMSL